MTEIYQGKRLRVVKECYRLPSGREKERVVIYPGDAAAMLPIDGDTCILLRQFRFAIGEYLCEAPAGTMDPGETPLATAQRELSRRPAFRGRRSSPGASSTPPRGSPPRRSTSSRSVASRRHMSTRRTRTRTSRLSGSHRPRSSRWCATDGSAMPRPSPSHAGAWGEGCGLRSSSSGSSCLD